MTGPWTMNPLRDHRDTRDWRPWRDPPGWWPCADCCGGGAVAYHCGGASVFLTTFYTLAHKTNFSDDTCAAVTTADLSQARSEVAPVANPDVAGYFAGGRSTSTAEVTTADKLTFSTEATAAATTANLTSARMFSAGLSERSTKGYFLGGSTDSGIPGVVTSDKLTFSGDSTAACTTANLSATRFGVSALTEGTTKGYVGGGATATGPTTYGAIADKVTFSSDSTAACTTANLTTARQDYMSASQGSTHGYWGGGQTGSGFLIMEKVTFSSDSTAAMTTGTIQRYRGGGSADGSTGYFAGGIDGSGGSNAVQKLDFTTEISSTLSGTITTARFVTSLSTAAL